MSRTLRLLPALTAALALVLLGATGCAKKLTMTEIGDLLVSYPEGTRDTLERTPSDMVVWPDAPNLVTDNFTPSGSYLAYRTGAGAIQGAIFDYTEAGGYQLFRRESGGGYRPFTDFIMTPYRRWADRVYFGTALGTVVLPPAEFYTFADASPPAAALEGYVARAVIAGASSAASPLTNLGETPSAASIPGIAYTGSVSSPDSLLDLHWRAVPGADRYWVHIYQNRADIRTGDEAIPIGLPSPIAIGKVRDLFIGYFVKPDPATPPPTSYKLGNVLPPGCRVLVYRVLPALTPVLVRVSAVDSTGRLIATTGLNGDFGAFREAVGLQERFRTFPLGAVAVTPLRPPPPNVANGAVNRGPEVIESGVPGLTYIRSGSASLLRSSR
jgi:hypothetical protein